MSTVFLDTSFVIALLNKSDPHHSKAAKLQASLGKSRRRRVTTAGVLLDLGDGFARKGRWDLIAPFLAAAISDPLVEIVGADVGLVQRAWELRNTRKDKDWGLTDCVSFVVMSDRQISEALTADHHFQQAGFRALLAEP